MEILRFFSNSISYLVVLTRKILYAYISDIREAKSLAHIKNFYSYEVPLFVEIIYYTILYFKTFSYIFFFKMYI